MTRNALAIAALALGSMLAGALLFNLLQPGPDSAARTGSPASPALDSIPLTDLEGRETLVGNWRDEILVVNFWAPWCAPCRREIPALIEVGRDYAARGVRILGIAFDNAQQVERFAADYAIDYPLFLSANRSAMYNAAFGNSSGSLPFTALLDRDLQIVFRHNGELSARQLRAALEKFL